jgi:hypothetical protein
MSVTPFACSVAAVVMMIDSDDVGEGHADHRVDTDAPHFALLRRGVLLQRPLGGIDALLLGFLGRLPDEQIGRNCRPQYRHQRRQKGAIPLDRGHQQTFQGLQPRHLDDEQRNYVSEQDQGQPFEDPRRSACTREKPERGRRRGRRR